MEPLSALHEHEEGCYPRFIIGSLVRPCTKRLRAAMVLRRMKPLSRHLDIGCADGWLLSKSPCREKIGLDKTLGNSVDKKLEFKDAYFDYITLLAVVEHLDYPRETLAECARILKPQGQLIMTTPLHKAEKWIRLYIHGIEKEHKSYFDLENMKDFLHPFFKVVHYQKFLFGMNQLFVCEKAPA